MRFPSFLTLLAIGILPAICAAQDDNTSSSSDGSDNAIHAVTTIHDDGSRTVTVTDPDKHTTEATTYNGANKIIERIDYNLDDNNVLVSGTVYGPDNAPAFKATYKHDDSSRISEEDDYTLDDQLIRRFTYEYGADGKLLRVHAYDSQGNELHENDAQPDERQSLPRTH
jgi:YD repeat-containing protein